ncbi:hypothetical protein SeLEV6574_g07249 [Synchytrium endobioticum]|uniref:Integrase zinc-binding domain-containing protein n=1 Tax=Synchytrium endobioticum TaxID=286115 RepID=A0A507CLI1_9FUNG|nr:hypothetical protein SeLEV6574_g07249 [Synchytrium endobioticum]
MLSRDPRFILSANEVEAKATQLVLPPEIFDHSTPVAINVLAAVSLVDFGTDVLDSGICSIQEAIFQDMATIGEESNSDSDDEDDTNETPYTNESLASIRYCQPHQEHLTGNLESQSALLKTCHDSSLAGHFGRKKSLELLLRHCWWRGISNDVKLYVESCDLCQRTKSSRSRRMGKLVPLPLPQQNHQAITVDYVVKLPLSELPNCSRPFDSIMVIGDLRSKWARFMPTMESSTAE